MEVVGPTQLRVEGLKPASGQRGQREGRLELLEEGGVRRAYGQGECGHVLTLAVAERRVGAAAAQEAHLVRA